MTSERQAVQFTHSTSISLCLCLFASTGYAQTFNSGSNGSDGALNLTNPGTYIFDPNDVATFGRVLDAEGDGIYHFTTINVAPGVILKMAGDRVNRPVYWLASGAVTLAGEIDLNGQGNMPTNTSLDQRRILSIPGAGGYAGGAGAAISSNGSGNPVGTGQPGQGPGGGIGGSPTTGGHARGRTFSGNRFLVPLVRGSGGGGAGGVCTASEGNVFPHGGSAGGGAIAIISSVSISVSVAIKADGGPGITRCFVSGGGSGGAIRLGAPIVSGNGALSVLGAPRVGNVAGSESTPGQVRIEALDRQFNFAVQPPFQLSMGTLFNAFVPASTLRVTRINGITVPPDTSGSFEIPDVTISQTQSVTVEIAASNIPLGTVVTLEVFSDNPPDNTVINQTADSTPLTGTLESSTAMASFTFPQVTREFSFVQGGRNESRETPPAAWPG